MQGTLLGNYRVVEQLGAGGMGVVYVGRHETLGNRVAVKVLRKELSRHADMVQRFFNEAQAATAIHNPGIVQVFDFGTTSDGRAYFAMELLKGETLSARLTRRRPDHGECCRLGRQIANVLQAAHGVGITHRDLKPDHLFLVPDAEVIGGERVKVLDFGIAKLAGEVRVKTRTGLMMGTPNYMSPEQCRSANVADARSDIYSLGCIMFEMVCGRPPFVFEGVGDLVAAHLHEPPPYPIQLAPNMPAGLSGLILNMLAKQPDSRPQTMTVVSQALDEILRTLDGSPTSTPSSLPARAQALPRAQAPMPVPSPASAPAPAPAPVPMPARVPMPMPVPSPMPPLVHAPTPAPVPQPSPMLQDLAWIRPPQTRAGARRLAFVLGGLVIIGAVAAIAIVLATTHPDSPERQISYDKIVAAPRTAEPATAVVEGTAIVPAVVLPPSQIAIDAPLETPQQMTASDLEAECRGYEVDRNWGALAHCAEQLRPLDPKRAAELTARAAEEAQSAPRIAGVEAALRDRQLKQARAELDQVSSKSVDYANVKYKYDLAEAKAIDDLVAQLARAKDASCEKYNQLLANARPMNPPRVTAEAARRAPCAPPPKCDVVALSDRGSQQFVENRFAESLAAYEAAYACKPAPTLILKAFVVACNLRNLSKARSYWKQLPLEKRPQALVPCVRNGLTEEMLKAP